MAGFLSSRVRLLLAGLVLFNLLVLAGCGSSGKTGTVQGKVTVDGTPANSGSVSFTAANGIVIGGAIGTDGSYKVIGVPAGAAQVVVTPLAAPPKTGEAPPTMGKDMPGGPPSVSNPVPIPAKYAKVETSGLTFPVKGGSNTYNIDLTAK